MRKSANMIFVLILVIAAKAVESSPIAQSWVYATILIANEWGGRGTGFLIARDIGHDSVKVFLCTNKHVLNAEKSLRDSAKQIAVSLNTKDTTGKTVGQTYVLSLKFANGKYRWKEHPDNNVDVLAFDVTDVINGIPNMEKKWGTYDLFADSAILSNQEITIGDDILVVGYPLGFKQGETNFPIVRQGIIASQIGRTYIQDDLDGFGNTIKKSYRGFLIDGGSIPGSSGSPIVLKPTTGRVIKNINNLDVPIPYLLGILAETRFTPLKSATNTNIYAYAGLGVAYDAATIKETIELFFK